MAYVVDDQVDVKVGTIWHPAVVKELLPNGCVMVDLDDPLPSLAACGKTHPRVPDTSIHERRVRVNCTGNFFEATDTDNIGAIRDRV